MTTNQISAPSGFEAMGQPIPTHRKESALSLVKSWGVGFDDAYTLVAQMTGCLERDKPFEAMEATKGVIDLTGAYRVMAVLLTG